MSGFFGRGGGSTPSSSSPSAPAPDAQTQKLALMEAIKSRLALANAQELVTNMNQKCYEKCITKPSTSLSSSEQTCLTRCMDRYLEAFNVVSQTYVARVSKERDVSSLATSLPDGGLSGDSGTTFL